MIEKYFIYFVTCSNLPWTSSFTRGESARTKTYSPIKYFIACYKNVLSHYLDLFWHRDKNTLNLPFPLNVYSFPSNVYTWGSPKTVAKLKDIIIELLKLVFIKRSYA